MAEQAIPAVGSKAELEGLQGGFTQAATFAQIGESGGSLRGAQLAAEPTRRKGEDPVQLLLAQPLLLGTIEGLDRQLVFARQLQHHIAEALTLMLHQKLDGIAAGTTGEAVVELLCRGHRH